MIFLYNIDRIMAKEVNGMSCHDNIITNIKPSTAIRHDYNSYISQDRKQAAEKLRVNSLSLPKYFPCLSGLCQ